MNTDNPEKPPFSFHAMTESGIDPTNIWKGDYFKRWEIARKLTKLAQDEGMQDGGRRGYVISINGGWGTGKTFMLTRWHRELQRQNRAAIYFDAWQDDFIANPLVAIIGQLQDMLEQFGKEKKGYTKKFLDITKKLQISLSLPFVGVSIPSAENMPGKKKGDAVEQYKEERKELEKLKEYLGGLVMEIREDTQFPLVFIIDELDRCRPTFALEILERVKHLFNLPGVVFVFGVNRPQLGKSVQSVYGEIDADEYLQKFFNLDLNLSVAKPSEYCRMLLNDKIYHGEMRTIFNNFYLPMLDYIGLSLRQTEHSAQLFKLGFLADESQSILGDSLACLVLLKTIDLDLYSQFVRGECKCKDVINRMANFWVVGDFDENNKSDCQYTLQRGIYLFSIGEERKAIIDYLTNREFDKYDAVTGENKSHDKSYEKSAADITKRERKERIQDLKEFLQSTSSFNRQLIRKIASFLDLVEYKG